MKKENYNYQGWLISDSFIKRSLAVVGYYTTGSILISIIIIAAILTLSFVFWTIGILI